MKKFSDLTELEVLAVAIASEEEDGRIYMTFAENLAERYPDSARIFEQMAEEEKGHRHMLSSDSGPICRRFGGRRQSFPVPPPGWPQRPTHIVGTLSGVIRPRGSRSEGTAIITAPARALRRDTW
jgi:hypothetical protein